MTMIVSADPGNPQIDDFELVNRQLDHYLSFLRGHPFTQFLGLGISGPQHWLSELFLDVGNR